MKHSVIIFSYQLFIQDRCPDTLSTHTAFHYYFCLRLELPDDWFTARVKLVLDIFLPLNTYNGKRFQKDN
jgi:hypothetical protein